MAQKPTSFWTDASARVWLHAKGFKHAHSGERTKARTKARARDSSYDMAKIDQLSLTQKKPLHHFSQLTGQRERDRERERERKKRRNIIVVRAV